VLFKAVNSFAVAPFGVDKFVHLERCASVERGSIQQESPLQSRIQLLERSVWYFLASFNDVTGHLPQKEGAL